MEQRKLVRLNYLFEKAVANNAKTAERNELEQLYQEFIDDGRETVNNTVIFPGNSQRYVS